LSYLEIGAGDGSLAREIRKKNFFQDIVLIEPNPYCAKICLKNNFSVIQDTFENALKKIKKFHCIAFFEVLEHIFSSYKFLKKCHSLLNKDGLVFFSCPNGEGFDVSLMQEYSNVIDHEHLNYFNISSINVLLKKCGFESIYIETPGSLDIDLIKQSYFSSKIEDKKYLHRINWIKNIDEYFQNEFQDFIKKNKISSHMLVIARKK
jgi:SAM-dependent methyltransferase